MAEEGTQTESPLKPALIGQCPEVEVMVQGKNVPCILDTGSQVTLFSQSPFQKYVQQEPIHEAGEIPWLTLKAAKGVEATIYWLRHFGLSDRGGCSAQKGGPSGGK